MITTTRKRSFTKSVCSAVLLASAGLFAVTAQAANSIDSADFLSGLGTNLPNKVKINQKLKSFGTKLILKDKSGTNFFNVSLLDTLQSGPNTLKKGKFIAKIKLDTLDNLISGKFRIKGKLFTADDKIKGNLIKARFTSDGMSMFGITDIVCKPGVAAAIGGCPASIPSILDLSTAQGMTLASNAAGTAAVVPVPAAIWLFGSGLLGLTGMARRRKLQLTVK